MNTQQPGFPIASPAQFRIPITGQQITYNGCTYYLGKPIGAGYFGTVLECGDEWGNQLAAKVLMPTSQTYAEVRVRWLDELGKLLLLRHPNITYVHAAFEFQNTFYLILERCGGSLQSLFTAPNLQSDLWFPYIAQALLQALQFIHQSGYVHKDIHPGNVFLSWIADAMIPSKAPVLQVKVGDLGISRLESDINIFHTIMAQWMLPPEALNPTEFGRVGRQIDIYHAGLLLLSLLLGRIPAFTAQDVLDGVPRRIAEKLPSPYAASVAWALRRHTADRPQSAIELWRVISMVQQQRA